jgi:hypothetical protein
MNFKKIALALAVASSFAAQAAEPATAAYLTAFQADGYIAGGAQAAVYTDFLAAAAEGNTAYVFQNGGETAGSVAFVTQDAGANYASVLQSGMGALAYVNQVGGAALNKAMIMQVETGEAARETTLTATSSVDELAANELEARTLSLTGNVALVSQVAGDAENSAVIYQNGTSNFAAVSQTGNVANFAYVTQMGVGSVAYVLQK